MGIHGGDIYRNLIEFDFSINVNPLGMPKAVKTALYQAINQCGKYPDARAEKLKKSVGVMLNIPEEYLLFGSGASELLMAVVHGLKPKKTVIPIPSFYGYEYAAKAAESEIIYTPLSDKENLFAALTEDTDLLFLANPNNPTGALLDKNTLKNILWHCEKNGIYVVLDECFIEFCGNRFSMLSEIEVFDHLILLRAFTKIFAIPGVRLGYAVCKDTFLLAKIARQIPEWNLSCFAQEAGCICALQENFIEKTERYIQKERQFLEEGFKTKGLLAFPSRANFILVYTERPLYHELLAQKILIRNCENFRGLHLGYYRIAVRNRKENEILLESL